MSQPKHPQTTFDIVIAGGGLAGLAMAVELSQAPFAALKVLVIEPRTHYARDRTWSFWASGAHAHQHLERHSWAQWRVAHAGAEAIKGQGGCYTYRTIDADAFYDEALAKITACPHLELRLGTAVIDIGANEKPCPVRLDSGETLHTRLVLDARAGQAQPHKLAPDHLAQHFMGWEIETEHDVFELSQIDLMDFQSAHDGLHFFYVLPYSKRRALVEATWVSAANLHQDHAAQLERYIHERWGLGAASPAYQKRYAEQASLSLMPVANPAPRGAVVSIGRAAGTLRASTGFAFLETLADCKRLAQDISQSGLLSNQVFCADSLQPFRRPAAERWMDSLFLQVLAQNWADAPALFTQLFRRMPSDRLIRFLSGQASWLDRACVVASLPKRPFLRPLFLRAWRRSLQAPC